MQALTIGFPTDILQFSTAASTERADAGAVDPASRAANRKNLEETIENGDITADRKSNEPLNWPAMASGNISYATSATLAIFRRAATEFFMRPSNQG
jgi:hypothetical protein